MKRSNIPMLNRIDTISHIMPYYGHTHRAFLLLSSLCSMTRNKLNEFYDEFVNHMREHWIYLEAYSTSQQANIFLPNDLFKIFIECLYQETTDRFIEFIVNLRDFKGWHFNNNYMHSQINIKGPIVADIYCIKKLYPYVDVMKSILVTLCKEDTHSSKFQY